MKNQLQGLQVDVLFDQIKSFTRKKLTFYNETFVRSSSAHAHLQLVGHHSNYYNLNTICFRIYSFG